VVNKDCHLYSALWRSIHCHDGDASQWRRL